MKLETDRGFSNMRQKYGGGSCFVRMSSLVFLVLSSLSWMASYLVGNVFLSISFIAFLSLVTIFSVDTKRITDPRILVSGFFFMYHTWFPFRIIFYGDEYMHRIDMDVLGEGVNLSLFSYAVIINMFNFFCKDKYAEHNLTRFSVGFKSSELVLFWGLFALSVAGVLATMASGSSSKREVIDNMGGFQTLLYFIVLAFSVVSLIRASRLTLPELIGDVYLYVFFFTVVLYAGVSGERDSLFRVVICLVIIFYEKKRNFNTPKYMAMLAVAAFIVPLSQSFKSIFLVGFAGVDIGDPELFGNEFMSASRNLHYILEYGVEHSWGFLFSDFIRAFIPTSLMESSSYVSTGNWYNKQYRVLHGFDGSSGWGFGLVAQGYLLGGYVGIFVLSSICSLVICYFFNRRYKSHHFFVFYVLALTVFIYVMRADFANFMSQIFKVFGLFFVLLWVSNRLLLKKR